VESVIVRDAPINISGIKVGVRPADFEHVRAAIARLPGTEITAAEPAAGRLAVVQERPTLDEQARGLRRMQAIPGVYYAELVCHYQEPEEI